MLSGGYLPFQTLSKDRPRRFTSRQPKIRLRLYFVSEEKIVKQQKMPPLTPEEEAVILRKGTERPGSGALLHNVGQGTYVCRSCGSALYDSGHKFDSGCGWPAFDDAVPGAVNELPDTDGRRVEIVCAGCGGHLGHVFRGEGFTQKNVRHCVNSLSLHFTPDAEDMNCQGATMEQAPAVSSTNSESKAGDSGNKVATAVFAGGCFWGVEHVFANAPGVLDAQSGYSGGTTTNPSYEQVCSGLTGHAEAVKVTYDPQLTNYEKLARLFFELHDPTQLNRQGPDKGTQYRSVLFYSSEEEKETAEKLIRILQAKGYAVATELAPAAPFYPAEEYHQDYLVKHPGRGCHSPVKRFE